MTKEEQGQVIDKIVEMAKFYHGFETDHFKSEIEIRFGFQIKRTQDYFVHELGAKSVHDPTVDLPGLIGRGESDLKEHLRKVLFSALFAS